MADNLCGGSTPLKALAEQGAQDRSLQQDRAYHSSNGPLNFRSQAPDASREASNSYTAYLGGINRALPTPYPTEHGGLPPQAYFASFEAPPQHSIRTAAAEAAPYGVGPSPIATWAQDFDSFSRQPGSASHSFGPAQSAVMSPNPVQSNHMRQYHATPHPSTPYNQPMNTSQAPMLAAGIWPSTIFGGHHSQPREGGDFDFDTAMQQWMISNGDRRAEEQVDAAMEEIARELGDAQRAVVVEPSATRDSSAMGPVGQKDDTLANASERGALASAGTERAAESMPDLGDLHLADDRRNYSAFEEARHHDQENRNLGVIPARSEVSEAARQLLQTVQHEQGEKWKKSQFLLLMRDFRDGQKDIIDNEIRQATTQ